MTSDWQWKSSGLYDGDVPIIWAAQSLQGELFVGVMEDWVDLIASVPTLAKSGTLLHPFAVATNWNNRHLVKRALRVRAKWLLRDIVILSWRVFWMALWEYVKKAWNH